MKDETRLLISMSTGFLMGVIAVLIILMVVTI